MNIACPSCPAKYGVPDEKVRGRKVRITCKRCGAAIIVDGTQPLPVDEAPAPTSEGGGERERQRTMLGGLEAPVDSAPGARQSQPPAAPAAEAAPAAIPKPAVGFPRPAAGGTGAAVAAKPGGIGLPKVQAKAGAVASKAAVAAPKVETKPKAEPPWTVAVTDDDHRDMSIAQVVDAYAAKTIDAETYIWRDGMDDWLPPFEIPEIKAALEARGLSPRTNDGSEAAAPAAPVGGAWREPGKWDGGGGGPTFDDVTVAMAAPKAQELLDAFSSDSEATTVLSALTEQPERAAPRPAAGMPAEATAPAEESPKAPSEARAEASPPAPAADVAAPAPVKKDLFAPAAEAEAPRGRMPSVSGAEAPRARMPSVSGAEAPRARMPSVSEEAPRSRMPSIPPDGGGQGSLTGARNESSVLFSLDQLTGAGPKAAKKRAEPKIEKVDADSLLFGGASKDDDNAPPSVANLGGGALFTAPTMAAPDFTAAVAPSAPSHPPPVPASIAPAAAAKKSGGVPWVALAAVALVVGGGAAFALFRPKAAPAPEATTPVVTAAPPVTAAPTPEPPASAVAATPSAAASVAPSPSGAPAASAAPAAPVAATSAAPPATAPGGAQAPAAAATPAAPGAPGTQPKPAAPGAAAPAAAPKPAEPAAAPAAEGPEFDKAAASAALNAAAASAQGECASQDGPHGSGKVTITFVNSGRATQALVSGDFAGSALGGCVARIFRGVKVPAFAGDSVRVNKSVHIP